MNEQVKEILDKEKNDFLLSVGLYEKEYVAPTYTYFGYTDNGDYLSFTEHTNRYKEGDRVFAQELNAEITISSVNINYDEAVINSSEFIYDSNGYYKAKPIDVTDEEYEKLRTVLGRRPNVNYKSSAIPTMFYVIAVIIYIAGFIVGIALANVPADPWSSYRQTEFNFGIACVYWFVAFMSGTFFIGMGKIISLLDRE